MSLSLAHSGGIDLIQVLDHTRGNERERRSKLACLIDGIFVNICLPNLQVQDLSFNLVCIGSRMKSKVRWRGSTIVERRVQVAALLIYTPFRHPEHSYLHRVPNPEILFCLNRD